MPPVPAPSGSPAAGIAPERVRAAARGDRGAQAEILSAILPRARNLVRYLVRGDADVDDIAQEALVAVLRGLGTWRAEGAFTAWADRVVARTTFAALRRRRGAAAREEARDVEELFGESARGDAWVARRELVRALDELPAEQRHALVLHHALGLSVPEIAEELGAPFETVRSRLRLGMAALRERFTPGGGP